VRFDYVIFRYNDENNNTSPYIIITRSSPDYAIMIRRRGIMEIGRDWLEINLKEGYKINYYREVHCL